LPTAGNLAHRAMETENRIERTIGLLMLAVLAIGCALVLRPFFTAVCFAVILVVATWPRWSVCSTCLAAVGRSPRS
jgi:predicted PurR-regulated permease PerM